MHTDCRCTAPPACVQAGFLLGSREALLETKDGGRTWMLPPVLSHLFWILAT